MDLSETTKALIRDRLEAIEDKDAFAGDDESFDSWADERREFRAVLEYPTTETLSQNKSACREIYELTCSDEFMSGNRLNANGRRVVADLCRAGYMTRHDPDAVRLGRRPTTMVVDDIRYEV